MTWLNRGTLHLVRSEDYPWLHALTAPAQRQATLRRLARLGVSERQGERAVRAVEHGLAADGPLTGLQLRDRIAAARVPTDGHALIHLLRLAAGRGLVVRGPVAGREQAYVLVREWLGEPPPFDRDLALAELARRYLAGHGPADDRDLARWAGLGLREARAGLSAIGAELTERGDGLVDLARRPPAAPLPGPKLLGPYDPLLLGWVSRAPVLGPHRHVVTVNGLFRPFALVRGRAAATWRLAGVEVTLAPFGRLAKADRAALEQDAADVQRFLGLR